MDITFIIAAIIVFIFGAIAVVEITRMFILAKTRSIAGIWLAVITIALLVAISGAFILPLVVMASKQVMGG